MVWATEKKRGKEKWQDSLGGYLANPARNKRVWENSSRTDDIRVIKEYSRCVHSANFCFCVRVDFG